MKGHVAIAMIKERVSVWAISAINPHQTLAYCISLGHGLGKTEGRRRRG